MNRCEWIVCERTNRWAAALHMAAARQAANFHTPPRVYEVRVLNDLTARLDERPTALALIEVDTANLAKVLGWLSDSRTRHARARFVALVDRQSPTTESTSAETAYFAAQTANRHDLDCALLEAGAVCIAESPRYLRHVLKIARHHASTTDSNVQPSADEPMRQWAFSLLPWQET